MTRVLDTTVWVVEAENGEGDRWVECVCVSEAVAKEVIAQQEANPPKNNGPYRWEYEDWLLVAEA